MEGGGHELETWLERGQGPGLEGLSREFGLFPVSGHTCILLVYIFPPVFIEWFIRSVIYSFIQQMICGHRVSHSVGRK